ncbi:MAG: hypothetical protein FWB91_06445 [Defluviitaleaceae bacterium]|nr:hypothetical protein [Defluviitaleaceae bacterium]MCL2247410.1 hypothetical protein [Lentimicrobiaceae bacterium]
MDVLTFVAFIIDRALVLGIAFFIWKKKNLISGFFGFKSEKSDGSKREFVVHGNIENSG